MKKLRKILDDEGISLEQEENISSFNGAELYDLESNGYNYHIGFADEKYKVGNSIYMYPLDGEN